MFESVIVEGAAKAFDAVAWEALLADAPFEVPPDPGRGFADCVPSGWAAVDLDAGTADEAALSDATLLDAIVGFDRVASWAAARQARLLAELARRRPVDPVPNADRASVGSRFVPDEVGVALKLARGTAAGRVGTACRLLAVLPATHALWEAGLIDTAKARAVDEATTVLPDDLAAAVEARVLPRAPEQSLAQLRAALARAILAVDPDGAAQRHREARKDRRVSVQPEPDGMGSLWALLTASDAAGAYQWLTRLARGLGKDDPRTMDARRADLLAELLNGRLVPDVESVAHEPLEGPDEGATPDGAASGGVAPDGTAPDGVAPDGTAPDGTAPDGAAPDGTAPAGSAPGGAGADGADRGGAGGPGAGAAGHPRQAAGPGLEGRSPPRRPAHLDHPDRAPTHHQTPRLRPRTTRHPAGSAGRHRATRSAEPYSGDPRVRRRRRPATVLIRSGTRLHRMRAPQF